jgi:phosphoenolpyruvate carboxylase
MQAAQKISSQTLPSRTVALDKTTPLAAQRRARDNERPLVEDIRLLGRILGDVIREQEGVEAYELVEQVRKLSVAFRRDADHEADRALKKLLKGLSGDQTVSVIRAFTYFSHLANLAEDRHHIRRRIVHERAGDTQEGSIEVALARLRWAGIAPKTIAQTLAAAYVSPVLTAHPTEVQRKSILDAERDIANLLTERDAIRHGPCPRTHWRRASWRPTKARCARVCCSCGRRGCCASPN